MLDSHPLAEKRIESYLRDVIVPAISLPTVTLDVAIHQCADRIGFSDALNSEFTPVEPGYRWGPLWSTAWFRLRGTLPDATNLQLRFDTGVEACLWIDGVPYHGFSQFHRSAPLPASFRGGEAVELWVEAACNGLWGKFDLDKTVLDGRYGHFREAAVTGFDNTVNELALDLRFGLSLARGLPEANPRRRSLVFAMNAAINALDPFDLAATADAARDVLRPELSVAPAAHEPRAYAFGHAHIDTAWLWPMDESKRKVYRTFSTALRNMEADESFRFVHTQPAQYEWIRAKHPDLFAQVKQRVAEGRWIPEGAMWVEGDTYISSGESIIRQLIHGRRWLEEHFEYTPICLWIPDNFGYCAALPQIMQQAGLTCLVTQKLSWNETNRFPHTSFRWRGLDGTEVLAHFLPAGTYNSEAEPGDLLKCAEKHAQHDRSPAWMYVFGYGDGGGGPHRDMLGLLHRAEACAGAPRVEFSPLATFVDQLESVRDDLPVWHGDLYLELHRGCWTSQADHKRYNRSAESCLRDAERLTALTTVTWPNSTDAGAIDDCWKTLLLNQFHDILCGTSIAEVHAEANASYDELITCASSIAAEAEDRLVSYCDSSEAADPIVVINPSGHRRSGCVSVQAPSTTRSIRFVGDDRRWPVQDANLAWIDAIPAAGIRVVDASDEPPTEPIGSVQVDGRSIENNLVRAELDDTGRVVGLIDKQSGHQLLDPQAPGNALVLYEDRPMEYDAWNIERFYLEKAVAADNTAEWAKPRTGSLRSSLSFQKRIGRKSSILQTIELMHDDPVVRFHTEVTWQEDHTLLRVLWPTMIHAATARYGVPFGWQDRPTHANTSWDRAQFEYCAHGWADISQTGAGLALLADYKHGFSCHGSTLGLSLLRAPTWPDPQADRGVHRFTYAVLPHAGDPLAARVARRSIELNEPLQARPTSPHTGPLKDGWAPFHIDASNILLAALKPAEDGDGIILRLHEAHGKTSTVNIELATHIKFRCVNDVLERPLVHERSSATDAEVRWHCRPFEILTLRLDTAGPAA